MVRQVSNGTIWAVGGIAPSGTAVDNGRGQLVSSGTNARLFRTSFPTARQNGEEDHQKHEARLAAALGLDRARRTLHISTPLNKAADPTCSPRVPLTQWNGTEWVKEGSRSSRLGKIPTKKDQISDVNST